MLHPDDRIVILLDLIVPGDPQSKGRPRHGVSNGKEYTYTPKETRNAEERLWVKAKSRLRGKPPVLGPVGLVVEFHCATRRGRDGDNMLKLVTDGLKGVVYKDDVQIEEWYCRVFRGVGKTEARTRIVIYDLNDLSAAALIVGASEARV